MTEQPDLFDWAENRPTADVIDAMPRIKDRVWQYFLQLYLAENFRPTEAKIIHLHNRERGAA